MRPTKGFLAPLLTHAVSVPAHEAHWTDIASAYLGALAGSHTPKIQEVVPFVRYEEEQTELTSPDVRRPVVTIHIGGAVQWNRRWPRQSYLEICARLVRRHKASIALVGGHEETIEATWLTENLKTACPDACVKDFAGCSINRLLNVYAESDLYIGNDSGMMHLAVALGLPVVAIFGPSNHHYLGPDKVDVRHQVVTENFPCSKGGCPLGCDPEYDIEQPDYPACMKAVSIEQVWEAVTRRLSTCCPPASA